MKKTITVTTNSEAMELLKEFINMVCEDAIKQASKDGNDSMADAIVDVAKTLKHKCFNWNSSLGSRITIVRSIKGVARVSAFLKGSIQDAIIETVLTETEHTALLQYVKITVKNMQAEIKAAYKQQLIKLKELEKEARELKYQNERLEKRYKEACLERDNLKFKTA